MSRSSEDDPFETASQRYDRLFPPTFVRDVLGPKLYEDGTRSNYPHHHPYRPLDLDGEYVRRIVRQEIRAAIEERFPAPSVLDVTAEDVRRWIHSAGTKEQR